MPGYLPPVGLCGINELSLVVDELCDVEGPFTLRSGGCFEAFSSGSSSLEDAGVAYVYGLKISKCS